MEFFRRAASREQLFHRLLCREPAGIRRSVVLLDAGPFQLGAPRLAQMAALVVFARRAAQGRADLSWGVLQDPHRRLRPFDPDALAGDGSSPKTSPPGRPSPTYLPFLA